VLVDELSTQLESTDVIVQGSSGIQSEIFFLAFRVKQGQRILADGSYGAMGHGLPAAIGAAIASGRRTVLVDGDGSIQPNIQELETVRRLGLPLKIVVVNNGGYASIRASQQNYFGRLTGADSASGLTFPELRRIADAYGIPSTTVARESELHEKLRWALETDGPAICEVIVPPGEDRVPRLSSFQRSDGSMVSRPLEDLYPFLDREEFRANMIIPPLPDE
jgi:acetolactate synthase I/II/III large subunit